MTREEAIIDLNALKFILDNDQYTDEIEEALDMAISALQQPEIIHCRDCKHWHINCLAVADKHGCDKVVDHTKPNFYCGYAERWEE